MMSEASEAAPRGRAFDPSSSSYSQAYLVDGARHMLFVSGQVPADEAGAVPEGFDAQCRLVWANIMRRLADAGMAPTDIAKVNIFLSSRDYRAANTAIRHEVLRGHSPAITIIIAEIFDEAWLLEIDVIACA